ncbi:MAG TPA: extracellular solute-binding protein [Pyrodictium sp.]|nr:extracellular solute-binding protein [Pyrodictium sp.]
MPEVLDPFAESTGIEVNTAAFADEDETEAKLRAGFRTDVVEMCSGEAGSLIEAGLVQPIDTSRIDKWDAIFDSFKQGEDVVDENGDVWIVPLQGGSFGIVYLKDETGPITSYDQLFFGDVDGDIAVSEEPISTIWDIAMALGYGPEIHKITDEQAIEAVDALIQMDHIRTTWSGDGDLIQLLATGEIVAASHATPDIAEALVEEGINAVYVAPEEGQILWKCGLGIAADAENLDAAYALINHYVDARMQLIFAEEYGYMASNSEILDIADQELIDAIGLDDPGSIDLVTIPEGLPDNEELWDEEWQRFAG